MPRRRPLLAAAALFSLPRGAAGQDFPSRPVSIVVASPAGGGTDFSARLVSEPLAQRLATPVVVDNRPGGNGALGLIHVARARPDGHTLTVGYSGTMTGRPAVEGVGDLDPARDFAPVGQITSTPQVMMVHPSVPARTMAEFIAYAKARPGELNYASAGNGSLHHLGTELLKRRAGIDLAHIPYRGTGETISDLLAGRVQFYMNSPPPVLQFLRDGRLRALATTGRERHPALPDVPCLAELGFDEFPVDVWYALYAPARTPPAVLDRLARELRAVTAEDAVRRRAEEGGTFVRHTDAAAVAARLKRETEGWVELVRAVGIKPD